MLRVWEHIHRLDLGYTVGAVKHGEVARLGGGIATDIHDTLRLGAEDSGDHILVHTGTRRVGDDNIRAAVLMQESVVEHIFHVAGKEQSVRYAVDLGVDLGILDCLGHILDTDDLPRLPRNEIGYRAGAGVEVVDEWTPLRLPSQRGVGGWGEGEVAGDLVELVRLLGVRLVERLRTNLELQALHLLEDIILTEIDMNILIGNRVVHLQILDIEQGDDLRELAVQVLE